MTRTDERGHSLVVEHTNQGTETSQGEEAHVFTVHYIVRHPEDCDREMCPIDEHIRDVGVETTLGLDHWERGKTVLRHIKDGVFALNYWSERYSGPEGDDWDAGVEVTPLDD